MNIVIFIAATFTLFVGHYFKVRRWEQFIKIYEKPDRDRLLQALSIGYIATFFIPFKLGELIRALIASKNVRHGFLFILSTIFIERFLDIIAVGILFLCFIVIGMFSGFETQNLIMVTVDYGFITIFLVPLCVILLKYSKYPKIVIGEVAAVFNQNIKLKLLYFSWAIISSVKDMYNNINKIYLLFTTGLMWVCYVSSYYLFALTLQRYGINAKLVDIFELLFSPNTLKATTLEKIGGVSYNTDISVMMLIYLISPLLFMLLLSMIFKTINVPFVAATVEDCFYDEYVNLLPYTNNHEKLFFLEAYFSGKDRDYFAAYLEVNRDINIIHDYSGGSHATTLLAVSKDVTFFRKYAFGKAAEKLREQATWITNNSELYLPSIIKEKQGTTYFSYDMQYDNLGVNFFNAIHSINNEEGWIILQSVLNDLKENLHSKNQCESDIAIVDNYIQEKVLNNIKTIKNAKILKDILTYEELLINGRKYKNLNFFEKVLTKEYLRQVFLGDIYADIHGDLTIENIIYAPHLPRKYYIIDPNPSNIHNSPHLDHAKLLQSLHLGYEFLMKTKTYEVNKNKITFPFTRSFAYEQLYQKYKNFLVDNYSADQVRSIFYHEIVHCLRFLPYKLEKVNDKAIIFYTAFIVLLNEVYGGCYEK